RPACVPRSPRTRAEAPGRYRDSRPRRRARPRTPAARCGCNGSGTRVPAEVGRRKRRRRRRIAGSAGGRCGPSRDRTLRACAGCRRPLRALPEADRCPRSGRATRPPPAGHARNLRRRSGGIRHAAAPSARARTGRRRTRLQYKDGPRPTTRAAASGSRRRECASGSTIVVLAVAELPLGKLAALLGLDAQRRDRTSLEAAQADLVARLLAVAVGAVLDALQRRVDLL